MIQGMDTMSANAFEFIAGVASGYPEQERREWLEELAQLYIDSRRSKRGGKTDLPSAERLRSLGFNIIVVADELKAGLDAEEFGKAVESGFKPERFHRLVERRETAGFTIWHINQVLRLHNSDPQPDPDLAMLHPHPHDRQLHERQECKCFKQNR